MTKKDYAPKYRVEYFDNLNPSKPRLMFWPPSLRKPSNKRAEALRKKLNESFRPSGANWYLSQCAGIVMRVTRLRVIEQKTGKQVADAKMPAFEVV